MAAIEYNELSVQTLREYLRYDPETGLLYWIKVPSNRVKIGAVAGTMHGMGYFTVSLQNVPLLAHRLVWAYVTGKWPTTRLDHRDMNRLNNRFGNLRPTTNSQNMANMHMRPWNTTGLKGVSWHPKIRRYTARIKVRGQAIYLGCFTHPELAHAAYCAAAERYFGEFARTK